MNTNPDEVTLALWLDDELAGADHAAVEAWALTQPERLASREKIRRWRATMATAIPASEEPPYPDFFNSRVLQAIREPVPATKTPSFFWKSWLMPVAVCAGMALTFWAGTQATSPPEYDVAGAPKAIPVDPVLYTPENGVAAEWFASKSASATVIVLNGVAAIPDSTDFSQTVNVPVEREIDSTASLEVNPELKTGP
ncbi:MAG: hypothetical protein RLZZ398_640 [Verrucomicrobiota bacterium]|jgi:hypothetical protein